MTVIAYVGGLRMRLIADSVFQTVRNGLIDLGWFASGQRHRPLTLIPEPVRWDEEVALNTLAVSVTDTTDQDIELGSDSSENRHVFYIDFFAENDSIGKHVIHDVRDILRGKITTIGRTRPTITVYDYSLATPSEAFTCEIEDIVVDRANDFPNPWQRHWWSVRFDVIDVYINDADTNYEIWTDFGVGDTWLDIPNVNWEDL